MQISFQKVETGQTDTSFALCRSTSPTFIPKGLGLPTLQVVYLMQGSLVMARIWALGTQTASLYAESPHFSRKENSLSSAPLFITFDFLIPQEMHV